MKISHVYYTYCCLTLCTLKIDSHSGTLQLNIVHNISYTSNTSMTGHFYHLNKPCITREMMWQIHVQGSASILIHDKNLQRMRTFPMYRHV